MCIRDSFASMAQLPDGSLIDGVTPIGPSPQACRVQAVAKDGDLELRAVDKANVPLTNAPAFLVTPQSIGQDLIGGAVILTADIVLHSGGAETLSGTHRFFLRPCPAGGRASVLLKRLVPALRIES